MHQSDTTSAKAAPSSPNRHLRAQSVSANPLNPALGIPGFDPRQFRGATRTSLASAAAASGSTVDASRQPENQRLITLFTQMYTQISALADNYKRDSGGKLEGNDEVTLSTLKDFARIIKEAIDKEGPILNIERYASFIPRLRAVQANATKSKSWFSSETLPTPLAAVIGNTIDSLEKNKTNYEVESQRAAERAEQEVRRHAEEEQKKIEAAKERERQEEAEKKLRDIESRLEARVTATEAKTAELIAAEKAAREQAEVRAKKAEEDAKAQREKLSEMESKLVVYNDALGSFKKQFLLIQGPEAKQLLPMFQQLLVKLGEPALPTLEAPTASSAAVAASADSVYSPSKHIIEPPSKNTDSAEFISWKKSNESQYEQYLLQDCVAKSRYYAICELVDLYKKFKTPNSASSTYESLRHAELVKSLIHDLLSSTRWNEPLVKSIHEIIDSKSALSKTTNHDLNQCLSLIKTSLTMYSDDLPSSYSKLKDRLVVIAKVIGQGNFVPVNKDLAFEFMKKSAEDVSTPQQSNGQKPI